MLIFPNNVFLTYQFKGTYLRILEQGKFGVIFFYSKHGIRLLPILNKAILASGLFFGDVTVHSRNGEAFYSFSEIVQYLFNGKFHCKLTLKAKS